MIRRDDTATCYDLDDATHRVFTVGHFHGSSLAYLNLELARFRELRIDRRVARELVYLLDHFARHNQLPRSFPDPDFQI